MDAMVAVTAFVLGLSASPGCLALCLPVMVPMITADSAAGARSGLMFSLYMALGRLGVYIAIAALAGAVGFVLLSPVQTIGGWPGQLPRVIQLLIAGCVITYAIALLRGWRVPGACPRAPTRRSTRETSSTDDPEHSRGVLPLLFGAMFGAMLCPAFLLLLGTSVLAGGWAVAALMGLVFWLGTLPVHLIAGTCSGALGRWWRERVRDPERIIVKNISAITLILVGVWWILAAGVL